MSWYKYWYYTIFFIYDSFGKDREQNKAFSVVCFSFIIYMVYSLLGAYTNMMFENPILKYIAHPCSHFIFIIMIYCFNGFLFWSEKKARIGRSIYREKNEKKEECDLYHANISDFCNILCLCVLLQRKIYVYTKLKYPTKQY